MRGWRGGTLLLLRQMPWLLGLISSAKHLLPILAKNKLKCLWPVCLFLFLSVCISREKECCLSQYQPLPGVHTIKSSIRLLFDPIHSQSPLSPCLTPISIFHHPSSQLFLYLSPSLLFLSSCSKAGSHYSEKRRNIESVHREKGDRTEQRRKLWFYVLC